MLKYGIDCSFVHKIPTLTEYMQWLSENGRLTILVNNAIARALAKQTESIPIAYIAGALTGVDEIVKKRYEIAGEVCETHGMFGYVPHLFTDPARHPEASPVEIRNIDFLWSVIMPDFQIAFLTPPAIGPGIEQGWAEIFQIPTVYCLPPDVTISRLSRGILNLVETIITYNSLDMLRDELSTFLSHITLARQKYPSLRVKDLLAAGNIL